MSDAYLITNGFDFLVAAMECLHCGRMSPADESTNMQTYLRDEPRSERLGVRSMVGDNLREMEGKRYLTVHPARHSAVLLDTWSCPFCGQHNWARIAIENDGIVGISSVLLDRATLLASNYVSTDVSSLATELSGQSFLEVMQSGPLKVLLRFLV